MLIVVESKTTGRTPKRATTTTTTIKPSMKS
jgi:hypothetical protein